jgi:hypothetical protein
VIDVPAPKIRESGMPSARQMIRDREAFHRELDAEGLEAVELRVHEALRRRELVGGLLRVRRLDAALEPADRVERLLDDRLRVRVIADQRLDERDDEARDARLRRARCPRPRRHAGTSPR